MPLRLDLEALVSHITSDDPVVVLLKGHLWIERALMDLIEARLPVKPKVGWFDRLRFSDKVHLAVSLGVLSWSGGIEELNRQRNKLAHEPTYTVNASDLQRLVRSFDAGASDMGAHGVNRPEFDDQILPAIVIRDVVAALVSYLLSLQLKALQERTEELVRENDQRRDSVNGDA